MEMVSEQEQEELSMRNRKHKVRECDPQTNQFNQNNCESTNM